MKEELINFKVGQRVVWMPTQNPKDRIVAKIAEIGELKIKIRSMIASGEHKFAWVNPESLEIVKRQ